MTGTPCSSSHRSRPRTPRRSRRIGRRPTSTRARSASPRACPPTRSRRLLTRRAHECYLTDQADDAIGALRDASALYRERGDIRRQGETLTTLSNILWCPGRGAEARPVANEAIDVLESLPAGPELVHAYATMSFLCHSSTDGVGRTGVGDTRPRARRADGRSRRGGARALRPRPVRVRHRPRPGTRRRCCGRARSPSRTGSRRSPPSRSSRSARSTQGSSTAMPTASSSSSCTSSPSAPSSS